MRVKEHDQIYQVQSAIGQMTGYSEAIEQVEEQGYYAFDSTTKHRHVFA